MKASVKFREEYNDLNTRITGAFEKALETGRIIYYVEGFEDDGEVSDDDIPMYDCLADCPTTYYIDNNGDTIQVFITAIDSDGIHIVETPNYEITNIIDFSELDGIYSKIEVLELIS